MAYGLSDGKNRFSMIKTKGQCKNVVMPPLRLGSRQLCRGQFAGHSWGAGALGGKQLQNCIKCVIEMKPMCFFFFVVVGSGGGGGFWQRDKLSLSSCWYC